jgi:hypothetical protein
MGQKNAAALAAISGFRVLAEDALKDAVNESRKALLAHAEAEYAAAMLALAEAERGGDEKKVGRARLRHFEAKYGLEDLRYRQKELTEASKESSPDTQTPVPGAGEISGLTDADCIKNLVDTGFIMQNTRITEKTVYIVKKGYSVLDVFDRFAKITGSERRARAIMFQNMSGVKSTLDRHRPKKLLKT